MSFEAVDHKTPVYLALHLVVQDAPYMHEDNILPSEILGMHYIFSAGVEAFQICRCEERVFFTPLGNRMV
jgi:hypothetical protein